MKILVIIVIHNGMKWLERCLGSVKGADVFAVDSASEDGSADFVAAKFPEAHLVRKAENIGFGAGNNLGLKYAVERGYDYVYLMNQDAWLEEDTLGRLVEAAESNKEYGILSPVQRSATGEPDRQFSKLWKGGGGIQEVKFVMAAHWLVRRTCILKTGAFAPIFTHNGEDDNYCDRARYHGYKIGISGNVSAVHDRGQRPDGKAARLRRSTFTGAVATLCNPSWPLFAESVYVILFAFWKSVKHVSFLPISYLGEVFKLRREIARTRKESVLFGAYL
ncbi:MAG: glycosyltransferase family 2 protein [Bacteroidales bacterium]|nr:glycosyltransferase family 2 protein [Bacteroidales bacterium]